MSLKTRASFFVALLIIIISAASSFHFVSAQRRAIEREIIARGTALCLALQKAAEQGLVEENLGFIKKASYVVQAEDVILAQVFTPLWQAMDAHPDIKLEEPADPEALTHFESSEELFISKKKNRYDFYCLVKIKPFADAPAITTGYARVALSTVAMQQAVGNALFYELIFSVIVTVLAILAFNVLIQRRIINPIVKLHDSVNMLKNGCLPDKMPPRAGDEIGELASGFYEMSVAIKDREGRLQVERDKVEEKNRQLVLAQEELVRMEKLEAIGVLSAGIAHEINNPLANASLRIEIMKKTLEERVSNEDCLNCLKQLLIIEGSVERASVIAKEVLQFSRQRELDFVPVDLNAIIHDSVAMVEHRLKGIQVIRNLADIPVIYADRMKLEQVFINLLNNAIEAMPSGGAISISSSRAEGSVKVVISDTGNGISDLHLARVFDPFFSTKEVGSGTGLGLSICYGIITQHKGTIQIASTGEKGTVVTILLPVNAMEPDIPLQHS